MSDYRFNWNGSPVWETDERKIRRNTINLSLELGKTADDMDTYSYIVRMFKNCNQAAIADLLAANFAKLNKAYEKNEELHKEILDLNEQLKKILWQKRYLEGKLNNIYETSFGEKLKEYEAMEEYYKKGKSLREIAKRLHCDKSTVKRRLIKMGVTIREKDNKSTDIKYK